MLRAAQIVGLGVAVCLTTTLESRAFQNLDKAQEGEPLFPVVVKVCSEDHDNIEGYAAAFLQAGWDEVSLDSMTSDQESVLAVLTFVASRKTNILPEKWRQAFAEQNLHQVNLYTTSDPKGFRFFVRTELDIKSPVIVYYNKVGSHYVNCSVSSTFDREKSWLEYLRAEDRDRVTEGVLSDILFDISEQDSYIVTDLIGTHELSDAPVLPGTDPWVITSIYGFTRISADFFNQHLPVAVKQDLFLDFWARKENR